MVGSDAGREDRKKKGNRWTMFFPSRGPSQIRAWIQAVRHVLNAGRVDVKVEEGSGSVVLVWPKAVTFYSAHRVHKMARDEDPSIETLGMPRCVDAVATASLPGGLAGAAPEPGSMKKRPAAAAAPEPGARKKRPASAEACPGARYELAEPAGAESASAEAAPARAESAEVVQEAVSAEVASASTRASTAHRMIGYTNVEHSWWSSSQGYLGRGILGRSR